MMVPVIFVFSDCECYTPHVSTETTGGVAPVNHKLDYKQNPVSYKFNSLSNGCITLRNKDIATPAYATIAVIPDCIDAFEHRDNSGVWQPLGSLLIW